MQSCIDPNRGDCHRAVIASLFELELEQVPNFRLYSDSQWFQVYWHFLLGIGWEYKGCTNGERHGDKEQRNNAGVNGFFYATARSRTFEGRSHAVVIDEFGLVVHDPNPNQRYLGVNIIETGEIGEVHIIEEKEIDQ